MGKSSFCNPIYILAKVRERPIRLICEKFEGLVGKNLINRIYFLIMEFEIASYHYNY